VYSREYDSKTLRFEASGGLVESSLIMMDKETDSYWSIMAGQSIGGPLRGTDLKELPVSSKLRWSEWLQLHPDTLVLSVDGREDIRRNAYQDYFDSDRGFRGSTAQDERLRTKQGIYAFRFERKSFAVPFETAVGGVTFHLNGTNFFFHRFSDTDPLSSTRAFFSTQGRFHRQENLWIHDSGAVFDVDSGSFRGAEESAISRLNGFDTYWYTWSPFHPDTEVLQRSSR
jgi:hypothetical protein